MTKHSRFSVTQNMSTRIWNFLPPACKHVSTSVILNDEESVLLSMLSHSERRRFCFVFDALSILDGSHGSALNSIVVFCFCVESHQCAQQSEDRPRTTAQRFVAKWSLNTMRELIKFANFDIRIAFSFRLVMFKWSCSYSGKLAIFDNCVFCVFMLLYLIKRVWCES